LSSYFRYLDSTEVFCPNDACTDASFASFPHGIIGPVSGFLLGTTLVCGGARTTYAGCSVKNGNTFCDRNAECVKTAGGSLWCTGPKTDACYTYDRYFAKNWVQSLQSLLSPRAYAASVIMPDGRLWILGGAGQSSILISTEFIELSTNGIQRVYAGPNMLEPLLGHCAALVTPNQVVVVGGFSSVLNDYTPNVQVYDFTTQSWNRKNWMTAGPRIDSSCLNVDILGDRQVLLAGGWDNNPKSDSAIFSKTAYRWKNVIGIGSSADPLPYPLRSSVMIERNQQPHLIGGVICSATGRPCSQSSKSMSHF
jgi:Kelch motif/Galactose oxidase, central domain